MPKKYVLTLDETQANALCVACEFYARVRCGQWQELIPACIDPDQKDLCEARDQAIPFLLAARKLLMPKLDRSFGHSHGVGKFEDSDLAWELYQVVRNKRAWAHNPMGDITVDFSPPMSFSGHPLPECEVRDEK